MFRFIESSLVCKKYIKNIFAVKPILETITSYTNTANIIRAILCTVGLQNNLIYVCTVFSILKFSQSHTKVIHLCETCLFKSGFCKVIINPS